MKKRSPLLALLLAATLTFSVHAAPLGHKLTAQQPRTPLPALSLIELDGQPATLARLRGKVAVINFWAVWCQPCRQEMPALERLRKVLPEVAVVAIAQDDEAAKVRAFLQSLKPAPGFDVLLDPDMSAGGQAGVRGLPTSLVLDKQGRVAYRALGGREFDHPDIIKAIKQLLAE
jgi:thiol-disulfide isomerase/thioredoxin